MEVHIVLFSPWPSPSFALPTFWPFQERNPWRNAGLIPIADCVSALGGVGGGGGGGGAAT